MANLLKGVIKVSHEQYEELIKNKKIIVNNITYNYDKDIVYIVEKVNVTTDTKQTISGDKDFTGKLTINDKELALNEDVVKLDDNQTIGGSKNFSDYLTYKNEEVAIKKEIPIVSDDLKTEHSANALSVGQGIILNNTITTLMENLSGRAKTFTVNSLSELGSLFDIEIKEPLDEYEVTKSTIIYKEQEYNLVTGDIFFVVNMDVPDYWFSLDNMKLYKMETMKVDLSNIYTIDQVDEIVGEKADQTSLDETNKTIEEIEKTLEDKVDKVDGKQLSSNDYTDEEKKKLSEIQEGAEVNVQSDWNATSGDAFIKNKPTKVSEFENDSKFATEEYVEKNGGKIDIIKLNGVIQPINEEDKSVSLEVEIPDVPTDYYKIKNKLSEVNLNTVVEPGNYGIANDCANMPTAKNGTLFVGLYQDNQYAQQMFLSSDNEVYIRTSTSIDNSTWNSWTKLVETEELTHFLRYGISEAQNADENGFSFMTTLKDQNGNEVGTFALTAMAKPEEYATNGVGMNLITTNGNFSYLNLIDLSKYNGVTIMSDGMIGKHISENESYSIHLPNKDGTLAIQEDVDAKQDKLTSDQLQAVNSGITSTKLVNIETSINDLETNKASKDFVNSSIATATSTFRGTYESVDDLPNTTSVPGLKENDYAFVISTSDEDNDPEYHRYKYTTKWEYEYTLNNSSFTAEQWSAINSGITKSLANQITTNKNDISTLNANKEDKTNLGDLAYKDVLTASDVGALPDTTTYVSSVNGKSGAITDILTKNDKPNINGNNNYTSSNNYYVPTSKGNYGQLLMSNGSGAPSWTNMPDIQGSVTLKALLPEEYQEVEYLECDGNQYIDTEIIINGEDFKMEGNSYAYSTADRPYNFVFSSDTTIDGVMGYYLYPGSNYDKYGFQISYPISMFDKYLTVLNDDIFEKFINWSFVLHKEHKVGRKDKLDILTEDGVKYSSEYTSTNNIANAKIVLFKGGIRDTSYNFIGKAGKFKIYVDGVIQRDFIPCYRKDDNVAGLYDLLNGVFYENLGTGSFIIGPDSEFDTVKQFQFMAQNIYQGNKTLVDTFVPLDRTISGKTLGKDIQLELKDLKNYEWAYDGNALHKLLEKEYYKSTNILPVTGIGKTITLNGLDFTRNGDGSITVNGTSTLYGYFYLDSFDDVQGESQLLLDENKTYRYSAQKISGSITGYVSEENYLNDIMSSGIEFRYDGSNDSGLVTSIGKYFDKSGYSSLSSIYLSFSSNYTYNNFTFGVRVEEIPTDGRTFLVGKGPIVHQEELEDALLNIPGLDELDKKQDKITDSNKLSNELISGLGTASTANIGTSNGNVPAIGTDGKLPSSIIPASAITDTFVANSQSEMLSLSSAEVGDVCVRTDVNKSFILKAKPYSTLANWQELLTPTDAVQSVNGQTGNVVIPIPTVYDGKLTIKKNGVDVGSFTANQSSNSDINIEGMVKITLDADSGTLSSTDLSTLKTRPHEVVFVRDGYYYFAENLSSSSIWYYSCNVFYNGNSIIKRVVAITLSSGAYTKSDYTYSPSIPTIPDVTINDTGTGTVVTDATSSGHTITLTRKDLTASDIKSGTLANGRLPTRLQEYSTGDNTDGKGADGATSQGWHYIGSTNTTNRPGFKQVDGQTGYDYRIMTTAYSTSWYQQFATDFRSNDVFVRRNQNGTLQPWTALVKMLPGERIGTDNALVRWDSSRNATIQDSNAILDDEGNLSVAGKIEEENVLLSDKYATKSEGVYFVDGTGNATEGTWEGTNNRITSYYDGLTINFKVGVAGVSGGTTLNINNFGAKPCYLRGTTKVTTQYAAGTMVIFTYNATTDAFYSSDYDANSSVTQTVRTTNGEFPLLLRGTSAGTTTTTTSTTFGTKMKANPSTGNLTATTFTENNLLLTRKYGTLLPFGTQITSSEDSPTDLNTLDYIKVGNYYCSANAQAKTMVNCPTKLGFMMQVYSPLSTSFDDETAGTYKYRVRKILDYQGNEYIQYVSSGSTAGTFTYKPWEQIARTSDIPDVSVYLPKSGGDVSGHIYLTGSKESSSTGNTSQIVFGTASTQHIAITSNDNAFVVNPTTTDTSNQVVLYTSSSLTSKIPGSLSIGGTTTTPTLNATSTINLSANGTLNLAGTSNTTGAKIKWATVNSKNPYIGYATDQSDGTFVIGSLLGTNYASGLAIGGGSGNLLWKGTKVATISDIPSNYVTTNTTQTVDGTKTFSKNILVGMNSTVTGYSGPLEISAGKLYDSPNLNNVIEKGYYVCHGGTNIPSQIQLDIASGEKARFTLLVCDSGVVNTLGVGTSEVQQQVIYKNHTYVRYSDDSNGWTDWDELVTTSTDQTIFGKKAITSGLKVSGRWQNSGDDEGIIVGKASNGYAGMCLGDPNGERVVFYLYNDGGSRWRLNDGTNSYDLIHPKKTGTIATTSDISNGSVAYATTAGKLDGFANKTTSQGWGNQTGTFIWGVDDSTGGSLAFRRDNPIGGQMSMVIDGTIYVDEGNKEVATKEYVDSKASSGGGTDHFKLVLRVGGSYTTTDAMANAVMGNFTVGEEGAVLFGYGSGDSEKRFLAYFKVKGTEGEWRQCDIHIGWNSGTSEKYIQLYDSYGYYGSTNSSGLTVSSSYLHALQFFVRVSS